jgi:NADPH-dependent F420 reductase
MTLAIIGTGNMAKGLATVFSNAGNAVVFGSRDPAEAASVAGGFSGTVSAASIPDAVAKADIIFLAVPYSAAAEVVKAAGDLAGKIVVDLTNPMKADFSGLAIGFSTSAAEEIAQLAPRAKVVKGFNTLFASVLQNGGQVADTPATVLLAGDDADAVAEVEALVNSAGLKAIVAGPLAASRNIEAVAALNIGLGYSQGKGTNIAPTWVGI